MRPARETTAGFRNVGDAVGSALHGIGEDAGGRRHRLDEKFGKGLTTLDFGMVRIREHAALMGMNAEGIGYVERQTREQYAKAVTMTESPIERAMIAALLTGRWAGCDTIPPVIHNAAKISTELLPPGDVVIVPQMAFVRFRLDFGVVIEKDGRRQVVAVECDGADFHQDAVHERFRDAYLHSWAVPTFRLKGSAIHEDAIAAADNLIASICAWKAS
jgi:hypothetical protein